MWGCAEEPTFVGPWHIVSGQCIIWSTLVYYVKLKKKIKIVHKKAKQ